MVMHLPDEEEEEVFNELAVKKRGRKKKDVDYKEAALPGKVLMRSKHFTDVTAEYL
jgi:hypothetical protein